MLEAALEYARRGWKVLPLQPRSKIPFAGTRGVLDATDNEQIIRGYWSAYPDANIGTATGGASGFFVIDIDPRNGGASSWADFPESGTIDPTVGTGGGGLHYYFTAEEMPKSTKLGPGIDVQSTGKYVVAPPSITDGVYEWADDSNQHPPPAPDWLLFELRKRERPTKEARISHEVGEGADDDRPGAIFNQTATWQEVLEPHGWTHAGSNGEVEYWTRPGKQHGISASTNYENSDLLWVFTSSTEFEQETSYSKFAAYTLLEHGGDYSAAAKALLDTPSLLMHSSHTAVKAVEVKAAAYSAAFAPEHFVSQYVTYASKLTDAPQEYHEAGALSLLAACTSLVTAALAPYPKGLHTNLYLCFVGASTAYRKSTAQRIVGDILDGVLPTSKLPVRMTTEGLIYDLAQKPSLPTVWMPDEFGAMLSQVYRRDYLRGLEELLLTLYGGDDYDYMKADRDDGTRVVHVRRPHLSVVGAATPESLALAGPGAMLGGLLPRFGLVYPNKPEPRSAGNAPDVEGEKQRLTQMLRIVLQWTNSNNKVSFTNEAIAILNKAEGDIVSGGTHVARLPAMLYKVAVLSACSRGDSVVNVDDAASAVQVVERWKLGAERLRTRMRKSSDDLQFEAVTLDALEIVRNHGGSVPRTLVARNLRTKKTVIDQIEAALLDWGYINIDRAQGLWLLNNYESD